MNNSKTSNLATSLTVLLILCLNYVGVGLVFPLFPQLCYDHSISLLASTASDAERSIVLGILLCLMPLTQFFFSPLLGAYSDVQGRRPLLIKSLLMGCLGYCMGAYAIAHNCLWLLFLSRVFVGIATSNSSVLGASLADMSSKEDRASYFSFYGMSVGAGMTLGPLLGAFLANKSFSWASYSLPFIAAGIMTFCNLLAVFVFFPKHNSLQKIKQTPDHVSPLKLLIDSFLDKKLRMFFIVAFFFYFGWTFFWEFIPITVMQTIGYPADEIGYIYIVGSIAYVALSLLITRKLVVKMDISFLLPCCIALLALFIGLTYFASTTATLYTLICCQQFLLSCLYPLLSAYISKNSSETTQGKSLGMLTSIKAAACTLGPLSSGLLFFLSTSTPIILGVITLLIALVCSLLLFAPWKKAEQLSP